MKARPCLKRVGGKGSLLPQILPHLPRDVGRYFEPFFGGGALFFELAPEVAFLSDGCPHLIDCYKALRDDVESVILQLGGFTNDSACYYDTRSNYNGRIITSEAWRAAAFIYMNRVCFNGLWRVNRKGGMNVPFGDMPNATICDADNLRAVSAAMRQPGVSLARSDFAAAADGRYTPDARGDLWYFDPPYVPSSVSANFTGYTVDGFTMDDHSRLASLFRRLAWTGAYCIASNSDTPEARELYQGFEIVSVSRKGTVSSKGAGRQRVGEILVLGGQWEKRGEVHAEAS